jgi:membrane protease YdiL (CAAX protease family)
MHRIAEWIKKHQIISFFSIVFAISWPSMIMMFYLFPNIDSLQALLGLIATFSPALVALLIASISNSQPKRAREPIRWVIFTGTWLLAWLILSLHTWHVRGMPLSPQLIIPMGFVAILPAWLISCSYSRNPGRRRLLYTLLHPKGSYLWYIVAFLAVPIIQISGSGLTILTGGSVNSGLGTLFATSTIAFIILTFLHGFLFSGGLNEETGWRGFALPRLQARYPVIVATVIVWFFWALWHLPYDIGTGTPIGSIIQNRVLFNFIWAVLFTWVYNRTRGSLLAPAIFHPAMNTFGDTLPRTDVATILFALLALIVIFRERMWEKLPEDNPARLQNQPNDPER